MLLTAAENTKYGMESSFALLMHTSIIGFNDMTEWYFFHMVSAWFSTLYPQPLSFGFLLFLLLLCLIY